MFDENIKFKYSWRPYQERVLAQAELYLKDKMTYVDGTSNSNATHMITMLGYRDINTGLV